jgi:hypothetical protein
MSKIANLEENQTTTEEKDFNLDVRTGVKAGWWDQWGRWHPDHWHGGWGWHDGYRGWRR